MNTAFASAVGQYRYFLPVLGSGKTIKSPRIFVILSGESNLIHVSLNNAAAPFDDPKVREAMNYAVDRNELALLLMNGESSPLFTGMSPAMGKYYNESLENTFTYDPDRAIALLAEAGYPEGFQATVTVPSNYSHHINAATIISDQLRRVGVDLSIVSVDWATWLSRTYTDRDFETTVIALTPELSPKDVLGRYASDADNNFISFSNDEYDDVLRRVRTEVDEMARIGYYRRLQEILVENSASVFFQDPKNIVAVSNKLSGYAVYPIYVQDMSTVHYN